MAWTDFFKLWWYAFRSPPKGQGGITQGDIPDIRGDNIIAVPDEDTQRKVLSTEGLVHWQVRSVGSGVAPEKGRAGSTPAPSAVGRSLEELGFRRVPDRYPISYDYAVCDECGATWKLYCTHLVMTYHNPGCSHEEKWGRKSEPSSSSGV